MRRMTWRTLVVALLFGGLLVSSASADEHSDSQEAPKAGSAAGDTETALTAPPSAPIMIAAMPVFVPPNMGAPAARLGGATRSVGNGEYPNIEVLVPEETGLTLREQPVLYWYLAAETDAPIEFVVRDITAGETLLQAALPPAEHAGIQRLALSDHGLKLAPDVQYFWLIKLIRNQDDRSYDRLAGGGIERIATGPELEDQLAAPGASRPHVLAQAGIWYDAIDSLSQDIDAAPGNRTLWNQRAALFEQVGLPDIPLQEGAAPGFQRR
ncbi:MAG: DUF928 domain-containing protein [Deltaproteobacteria bacterium]|nr:DUF928 domain-containing protein [Deltaproteobacteria bacterium]MBW2360271.1 DUF928 domain-containing protein [Deltaproteobacteria bacterium]